MGLGTILLGLSLLLAGCTARTTPPQVAAQAPQPTGEPRTVTDLSQISSASTVTIPLPETSAKDLAAGTCANRDLNATVQQNVERLFVANVNQLRYHEGRAEAPGAVTLLNDKAQKFSGFAYQLLNQTLAAARSLEAERLEGRKLPQDISAMVLTAVMDSAGRLTEISVESHSGDRQIDQIIIDSSKKGLWSRNPPSAAIGTDGSYRVRLRCLINSSSFDYKGRYQYDTQLGLAIL